MAKKWIAVLLLLCMVCGMLSGCKEKITAQEAVAVVLSDLGEGVTPDSNPHVHEGTYDGKNCFNVFITVEGMSLVYVVSDTGKILTKGPGAAHSH